MNTDPGSTVRARLVSSARALIVRDGLRQATARRTAADAHVSVSLINYHFGDRDGLICAVYEAELAQHGAWLDETVGALAGGATGPEHLADWLSAFVMRRAMNSNTVAFERILWINAGRVPGLAAIAGSWMAAIDAFAGAVAAQFQLDPSAPAQLAEFYLSCDLIVSPAMSDQAGMALANLAARRFAWRLAGAGAEPGADPDLFSAVHGALTRGPAFAQAAPPDASAGRRIIKAALDVIAREGADAVNHRLLAQEAGVPLSATTRHFSSRTDILRFAFEDSHGVLVEAARDETEGVLRLTPDELADGSAAALVTPDGEIARSVRVMEELFILAQSDSSLSGLARSLAATRGETSIAFLRAAVGRPETITRTDAFVWSMSTFGMVARLHLVSLTQRQGHIRRRTLERLALFQS